MTPEEKDIDDYLVHLAEEPHLLKMVEEQLGKSLGDRYIWDQARSHPHFGFMSSRLRA